MNDNEILEGNKLIAEFMGGKYMPYTEGMFGHFEHFMFPELQYDGNFIRINDLQYCSSWDWLMPVVEKIIEIDIKPAPNWEGYRVEIIPRGYVKITGFPMPPIFKNASIEGSLINATWLAVVEFIKWYNQNKQ